MSAAVLRGGLPRRGCARQATALGQRGRARRLMAAIAAAAALSAVAVAPPTAQAHGLQPHGPAAAAAASAAMAHAASSAGVSDMAVERMLAMQLARGGVPDDALRGKVVQVLRNRALFAREARAAGLADQPRVRAELEIATNQILAQAFEEQLRRDVAPTEAELRQRYGAMRDAAPKGIANVAWPSFAQARDGLAQTMVDERIARRLDAIEKATAAAPARPRVAERR